MANTLAVTDYLSMELLRLLLNPLEIGPAFNTQHNSDFTKDFQVGETVRVPFPNLFAPNDDNTLAYTPQPIIDRTTTVTIDKVAKAHFEWDSVEEALKMPNTEARLREKVLKPAAETIKQKIDSDCALWAYQNSPNIAGILGTNPTTFDAVYGAAGQRFQELGAWLQDKRMFLAPSVARALRASAVSQFNPADEITRQFKKGSIGEVNGFDSYSSMSLYRHTAGTLAGAVTTKGADQSGSTLLVNATNGDTFLKGDVYSITGINGINIMTHRSSGAAFTFVVTANVTAASSEALLSIYPSIVGPGSGPVANPYQNVTALPGNAVALTLFPGTTTPSGLVGWQNLAIGQDAFALVSVPLANPKAAEMSSRARDPKTGVAVSFLRMFDPNERKFVNRFDCIYGFGNFYADRASCRVLSA